jgi:pimeloyl-ACP methyl ester carboxylesterase
MSKITVNGVTLFYKEKGSGPETLVFSHGYLVDSTHFAPQIEVLSDRYRCIAYDHRGHGRSQATEGGYDMENLYADAVALIEALNCAPCHFVGLSTITAPTLVIVGEKDMARPLSEVQRTVEKIHGAKLVIISEAAYLCTIEEPGAVTTAIKEFLNPQLVG